MERARGSVRQEGSALSWRAVFGVFGAFLGISAAGVLWVALVDTATPETKGDGATAAGADTGDAAPAGRPSLIEHASAAESLAMEQRAVLSRFEWIDREAGIARISIEHAMRAIVAQSQRDTVPDDRAKDSVSARAPGEEQ